MRRPFHRNLILPALETALLLVDLQEEQRSDPQYNAAGITTVLGQAARLLKAARAGGLPIAHAQYIRDFNVIAPRPFEVISEQGRPMFSAAASGQTDICAEVAPVTGDAVFVKNDASSFEGTHLHDWLQAQGTHWLVVCGVWTEACIAATVRDAIALGYRVLLVKDACASGSKYMHETAVLHLANRLYGGGICDTDRACDLLAGRGAGVWQIGDPVPFRFDGTTLTALYNAL
jgi:maleamate amidohydrolase